MENKLAFIIPILIILIWNVGFIFYGAKKMTRGTFPSSKLIFSIVIGYSLLIVFVLFSVVLITHSINVKILLFLFLLLIIHLFIGIPVAILFNKAKHKPKRREE